MGPRCPLSRALKSLTVSINENLSSLSGQMLTSHWCMALEFDISYVINAYLNAYVKASEISAPPRIQGGKSHCCYSSSLMSWSTSASSVIPYLPHSVNFSCHSTTIGRQWLGFQDSLHPPAAGEELAVLPPRRPGEEETPLFP